MQVARSATLRGPYTRYANNPILAETEAWKCAGHGTLVTSAHGKDFFLYHAYSKTADVYTGRQGMLAAVEWSKATGWPTLRPEGEKAAPVQDFRDDFSAGSLSNAWQWDFRHSQPTWQIKQGVLLLAGSVGADNLAGTALTVRPLMGTYAVTTEVAKHNAVLKGLVLYGDASEAVGIGVRNDTVEVWAVKDQKRTVLQAVAIKAQQLVQMKMTVEQGSKCRFFWRSGNSWTGVNTGTTYYQADFLPLWDRSPRPCLLHQGAATDPATFSSFAISY